MIPQYDPSARSTYAEYPPYVNYTDDQRDALQYERLVANVVYYEERIRTLGEQHREARSALERIESEYATVHQGALNAAERLRKYKAGLSV